MSKKKNKSNQLERISTEVVWEDAQGKGGWRTPEEVERCLAKAMLVHTIGYLVGENKERLALTTGISEDGNYMDITTIPRPCVKKITYLDK